MQRLYTKDFKLLGLCRSCSFWTCRPGRLLLQAAQQPGWQSHMVLQVTPVVATAHEMGACDQEQQQGMLGVKLQAPTAAVAGPAQCDYGTPCSLNPIACCCCATTPDAAVVSQHRVPHEIPIVARNVGSGCL
jgi:hypothetical protein